VTGGEQPEPSAEVGVGPWAGPAPDPDSDLGRYADPDLLRDGDRRNVVDAYRYWRHDAIVADLDTRRHAFHVAIENWQHDLNIGSVVRTANAFLAAEVHIVGRRRWNRHVRHHPRVGDLLSWAAGEGLPLIGVDNQPGSRPIELTGLPRACVLVFGQEGPGLTPQALAACAATVSIAQFGSTRSLNAGAAAAIAMHAWVRTHADLSAAWRPAPPPADPPGGAGLV
jgi:tRNA G18 (ribose-2'-O)-methylase SpoU